MADRRYDWPWRMIVRGAFQNAWSIASQEEKNAVFDAWKQVHLQWQELGCRLIATLDDELSMAGQPRARMWNFYSVWEIPDPAIAYDLTSLFRVEDPAVIRLDKYFSIELVVGKPIGGLERALGATQPAT
jgi:hypothetical protein